MAQDERRTPCCPSPGQAFSPRNPALGPLHRLQPHQERSRQVTYTPSSLTSSMDQEGSFPAFYKLEVPVHGFQGRELGYIPPCWGTCPSLPSYPTQNRQVTFVGAVCVCKGPKGTAARPQLLPVTCWGQEPGAGPPRGGGLSWGTLALAPPLSSLPDLSAGQERSQVQDATGGGPGVPRAPPTSCDRR